MTGWPTLPMSQLGAGARPFAMGPFGSRIKAENFRPSGVPVLRGKNLAANRFDDSDVVFVDPPKAEELAASIARPGDLVFTHRGTLGQVALVPRRSRYPFYLVSQSQMKATLDEDVILPEYAYCWFCSDEGQHALLRNTSQTGVPAISQPLTSLQAIRVPLPPLSEQRAIAEVLGALGDKIEANRKIVSQLRILAVSILQDAVTTGGRYVVGEVAEVRKGLSYTGAGLAETGMPMVNLANAENYGWLKRSGFKHYTGPYKPRHVAPPGSLLVSGVEQTWRYEIIGWPLLLPDDVGPALFSQDIFLIDFLAESSWLRLPLWAALYAGDARTRLEGMAYGTTVARFPTEALAGLDFLAPEPDSAALEGAETLLRRAWVAERESGHLAALRDTLLPKLLSGELRVRDAERVVEAAV